VAWLISGRPNYEFISVYRSIIALSGPSIGSTEKTYKQVYIFCHPRAHLHKAVPRRWLLQLYLRVGEHSDISFTLYSKSHTLMNNDHLLRTHLQDPHAYQLKIAYFLTPYKLSICNPLEMVLHPHASSLSFKNIT